MTNIVFRVDWTNPENRERFPDDQCAWCFAGLDDATSVEVFMMPSLDERIATAMVLHSEECRDRFIADYERRRDLYRARAHKRAWHEIDPTDAADVTLPNDEIWGPLTTEGMECPWPWEPQQLVGAPLGQYHCPYCLEMVVAGVGHIDYAPRETSEQASTSAEG